MEDLPTTLISTASRCALTQPFTSKHQGEPGQEPGAGQGQAEPEAGGAPGNPLATLLQVKTHRDPDPEPDPEAAPGQVHDLCALGERGGGRLLGHHGPGWRHAAVRPLGHGLHTYLDLEVIVYLPHLAFCVFNS